MFSLNQREYSIYLFISTETMKIEIKGILYFIDFCNEFDQVLLATMKQWVICVTIITIDEVQWNDYNETTMSYTSMF